MRRLLAPALALLALVAAGCRESGGLPTAVLRIKDREITVEVASTRADRERGLMYRETLPEDRGMLFIYPQERVLSFWMRNTTIPLSIAYLDAEGAIREIYYMRPLDFTSIVSQSKVRYALEVNEGWFERHGIEAGDRVVLPESIRSIAGEP